MSQFPNQPGGHVPPPPVPVSQPGKGLAIAAMILGIVGLLFSFIGGWFLGIVGIILAIIAKSKGFRGGMATAGLIMSIISLVLGLIIFIACFSLIFHEMSYWM